MAFETSLFRLVGVDEEACAMDALLRKPGSARIGAYPSGRSAGQMQNAAARHWFTTSIAQTRKAALSIRHSRESGNPGPRGSVDTGTRKVALSRALKLRHSRKCSAAAADRWCRPPSPRPSPANGGRGGREQPEPRP